MPLRLTSRLEIWRRSPGVTRDLLQLDRVAFHYPHARELFHDVNMSLNMQSRIAVVGANGEGKVSVFSARRRANIGRTKLFLCLVDAFASARWLVGTNQGQAECR